MRALDLAGARRSRAASAICSELRVLLVVAARRRSPRARRGWPRASRRPPSRRRRSTSSGVERQQVAVVVDAVAAASLQLVGAEAEVERALDLGCSARPAARRASRRRARSNSRSASRPSRARNSGSRPASTGRSRRSWRRTRGSSRSGPGRGRGPPRRGARARLGVVLGRDRALELLANPRRELGGRLLGEGDHRELVDGRVAAGEDLDDAPDERGRLAGAGAGLDQRFSSRFVRISSRTVGVDGLAAVAAGGLTRSP